MMGEDDGRAMPGAAEGPLLVGALVRIVAAEGPGTGGQRPDITDQTLRDRIRAEVGRQPLHVRSVPAIWPSKDMLAE